MNYLCEFRLDSADVELITSGFEAESLRIDPLGTDANNSIYWYFFGTRLYREDINKINNNKKGLAKSDRVWQVICFTEQDWQNLASKFKHSKSRKEIALYKVITEDFIPNIPALFKAKEAERRRRFVVLSSLKHLSLYSYNFRLFQRRSSLRVKGLTERKKEKLVKDNSEDESDSKLSFAEKYLEQKKKSFIEKSKIREQVQFNRALRAQRRLDAKI